MIKKGDRIQIKSEWQDEGDEKIPRFAASDEYDGKILIVADLGWLINPTELI